MDHEILIKQIEALAEEANDPVPVLANASALLNEAMDDINWVGFYIVKDGCLVLGPFQGKPACVRIESGRGVCGTALATGEPQLVPDVHEFPGHIACDSASASEIVIPIRAADARPETNTRDTTVGADAEPRDMTAGADSEPRDMTADEDSEPRDTTVGADAEPRDMTADADTEPRDMTADADGAPRDMTAGADTAPRDTTVDENAAPRDTTAGADAEPRDTTADEDAEPRDTTADADGEPRDTTADADGEPRDTTVGADAEPHDTTVGADAEPRDDAHGKIVAVLDIDSPLKNRFSEADLESLAKFVCTLQDVIDWQC